MPPVSPGSRLTSLSLAIAAQRRGTSSHRVSDMQNAERAATYDEIIADPLFRRGYDDYFEGRGGSADFCWSDEEQLAYERGRHFGVYVKHVEEERVPLSRGGLPHPRAKLLLLMAMCDGDVA